MVPVFRIAGNLGVGKTLKWGSTVLKLEIWGHIEHISGHSQGIRP